jgi:hypothetical protein
VSESKTNSFFWLPASALAALTLMSLIAAYAALSSDAMMQAPPVAVAAPAQAASAAH